ncbi:MAG: 4'-phosphopantetheinyl transferase superfamily protein [Bdellovibrionales bacterium]|jgi:enterobactin synthetase component D|nr:4'-phosphopantetheinyl transferase superfamily protein [Bdellovibrionales bacterium]MBT3524757.1 4'-phosphopantetheinyl transferase superfamily protein [Bdellovibrionales bacterium]MBT7669338.1 4'-phosphopantetheinyl transferase superfamily protein [Bdellovibrionales bacterium]MBT7767652.1 4'-phosphopantetheinyl transferase superfamily protein [Bdellovibrionales bacterium]
MSLGVNWSKLFQHSQLEVLSLAEAVDPSQLELIGRPPRFDKFHPGRQQEFLYGRLCVARASLLLAGSERWDILMGENRAPIWPEDIVGAISHGANLAAAALAYSDDLLGLGIDIEARGRLKDGISRMITNPSDLQNCSGITQEDLLTLIFSAKESLYKALYPQVRSFFGFETASLVELDLKQQRFTLRLISQIGEGFGPGARELFDGKFSIETGKVFTAIEVLHK